MKRTVGTLWVASVLLPLALLVGAGWWCWQGVSGQIADQMTRTVDMLHEHALRALEAQEAVLSAIDWNVRSLSWQEIGSSPALKEFLVEIDDVTPTVEGIGLVAPDGRLAVGSMAPDRRRGTDLTDRDYVVASRAGHGDIRTFIGAPHRGRGSGVLRVDLSRPRRAQDGKPDGGVIYTGFRTGYFEAFYRSIAASPEMAFAMFRPDGIVLASYPLPVPDGGARLAITNPALQAAQAAMVDEQEGRVVRLGAPSLFGGTPPTVLRQIGNYPLFIAYTYDMAVGRAEWTGQMVMPAIAIAIAMALMLLMTARAQNRVALQQAVLAARQAAAQAAEQQAVQRAEIETRLRQSEKVAALGQLAAGVAHDFNQLLKLIAATAQRLRTDRPGAQDADNAAALLLDAVGRGGELVGRMLAFARRDDASKTPFAVEECLVNLQAMLGRALGGSYELRLRLTAQKLPPLHTSQAEFEAVIVNLVTNARDAMPEGGTILVRASTERIAEAGGPKSLEPGDYLQISTTDTGAGMDAATLARAGQAFFTTKPGGTGLGLSMARGFAERSGGSLAVQSSAGHGTKVVLWLPVTPAPTEPVAATAG
jgi:two-component system NtrC family sensor kinase